MNESPVYVCPTSLLIIISAKLPRTSAELHLLYSPLPPLVHPELVMTLNTEHEIENILTVITQSLEELRVDQPLPKPVVIGETIEEVVVSPVDEEETAPPPSLPPVPLPDSMKSSEVQIKQTTGVTIKTSHQGNSSLPQSKDESTPESHILTQTQQGLSGSVLKVVGVVIALRIVGSFIGIPFFSTAGRNLFGSLPTFFSWSFRWRMNSKRL
jgi:hypothetical protein